MRTKPAPTKGQWPFQNRLPKKILYQKQIFKLRQDLRFKIGPMSLVTRAVYLNKDDSMRIIVFDAGDYEVFARTPQNETNFIF